MVNNFVPGKFTAFFRGDYKVIENRRFVTVKIGRKKFLLAKRNEKIKLKLIIYRKENKLQLIFVLFLGFQFPTFYLILNKNFNSHLVFVIHLFFQFLISQLLLSLKNIKFIYITFYIIYIHSFLRTNYI